MYSQSDNHWSKLSVCASLLLFLLLYFTLIFLPAPKRVLLGLLDFAYGQDISAIYNCISGYNSHSLSHGEVEVGGLNILVGNTVISDQGWVIVCFSAYEDSYSNLR